MSDWLNQTVVIPLPVFSLLLTGLVTVLILKWKDGRKEKTSEITPVPSPPSPQDLPLSPGLPRSNAAKGSSNSIASQYRFEQEIKARTSSEYTRRGQLWSQHPSWHLNEVPRVNETIADRYRNAPGLEHVRCILKKFDVDVNHGFLPAEDPLQRLPYARYHVWEDLADDLPKLLGARLGQARAALEQLPVLSTDKLCTDADLRRAHLLLCLFAHAYIWGGHTPKDYLPEGIARPLYEVSQLLHIPPILGHTSIVLYNWRRLDVHGEICMENLSTLNNFFDGRDESWFYLVTVEIEARGAASIIPLLLANDAIQRYNEEQQVIREEEERLSGKYKHLSSVPAIAEPPTTSPPHFTSFQDRQFQLRQGSRAHSHEEDGVAYESRESSTSLDEEDDRIIYIHQALVGELSLPRVIIYVSAQLKIVAQAVQLMTTSLLSMREGCHPFIFYHRVRPFLSGWKHNPTLPKGVLYHGVSETPFQFYGGSAAQSALIPFLDICFGIEHESVKSRDFLLAMRDYMLQPHRDFLKYMESIACLRPFLIERMNELEVLEKRKKEGKEEKEEDGKYLIMLKELQVVYNECIENIAQFRTGHIALVAEYIMAQQSTGKKRGEGGMENSAGGKGTGGTDLMSFLKPIRDDVKDR